MRKGTKTLLFFLAAFALASCSDNRAEERRLKEAAEAKARAEAARKEMDTLPKTFKSRDIFKKNEPVTPTQPNPPEAKK